MAFQFPWTNFHELNLDWFLSKFKQFTDNFLGTTATAESVPYGTQPTVTVTGGELDDDTDIVDPFTFNFKIPAGQQGEQGEQGVPGTPGQDGFSPIATVTKSGTVATITITDANGTTSTTISDGEVTLAQLDTKAPAISPTISGSVLHFSDGADNLPMSELIVGITPSQSGSGDPAPDNIRPISGWTGANVTRAGKNLFPVRLANGTYSGITATVNNDGSITFTGTKTGSGNLDLYLNSINGNFNASNSIPLPAGNYKFSGITGGSSSTYKMVVRERFGNSPVYYAGIDNGVGSFSFSTNGWAIDIYMRFYAGVTLNNPVTISPMVYLPNNATPAFAPYITPTILPLTWQTEAGTVYGGALDVGTGVLTVTDGYIASYNSETLPSTWISDRNVYAPGTTPTTGAEVVYKLATPQTYQLTPQQLINTWYGVNSLWSDTGDCTVTYTADTMLYVQNLSQPMEDDMIANTAISNGKFFMIGNNLYRATTAIASGSQIIPGTNATPMSLADALNLL